MSKTMKTPEKNQEEVHKVAHEIAQKETQTALKAIFQSHSFFMLFEDRINEGRNFLFTNPVKRLYAKNKQEINAVYEQIEYYKSQKKYIAGMISYEYEAEFYVFDAMKQLSNQELDAYFDQVEEKTYIYDFKTSLSQLEYTKQLQKLKHHLKNGNTYQTNFTFMSRFQFTEPPLTLYKDLRQRQQVEFGAFFNLKNKTILSLSPELFIQRTGNRIHSKPMKGTLKRDPDKNHDDAYYVQCMQSDEKMRSENLMIVDLIRNDLTKIALPKTVSVKNLFEVQKFQTLYQMISTVEAKLPSDIHFKTIMNALFPCGSITGAPKVRTMQIIEELEKHPRGLYTGTMGFILPNGDFTFNIAIRTIQVDSKKQEGFLGIGGGILYDSDIVEEWKEALLKSKFLRNLNQELMALETMRFITDEDGTQEVEYEKEHQARLLQTMKTFGITQKRIRLKERPLNFNQQEHFVCFSENTIDANSIFRHHKTNQRHLYNQEFEALPKGFIDLLYFNEDGFLAEASRHNVYLEINGTLYTPPLSDGALGGILRGKLVKKGKVLEKQLTRSDFFEANRLYLSNAVHGFFEVKYRSRV